MSNVGSASAGKVLQGAGVNQPPTYSTATYPSTATSSGQILKANGTNWVAATYSVNIQTFTSSGTYTPTTGMQYCIIECVGGGGGSGGCATTGAGQVASSGGGGGGEYARGKFSAATIGASQSITVGTGGTAGTAGNNTGGTGNTTSVGALISAIGGTGGNGSAAGGGPQGSAGGAGGTGGTGGDFRIAGQPGGNSSGAFSTAFTHAIGGTGGNSYFGYGTWNSWDGGNAVAGQNYGGGAAGGSLPQSSGQKAGAAGGNGLVVITEYIIN